MTEATVQHSIDEINQALIEIKIRQGENSSNVQQYASAKFISDNAEQAAQHAQKIILSFEQQKMKQLITNLKGLGLLDPLKQHNNTRHPYFATCIGPDYGTSRQFEELERIERKQREYGEEQEREKQIAVVLNPARWSENRKASFLTYIKQQGEFPMKLLYLNPNISETVRNYYNLAQLFSEKKILISKKGDKQVSDFYVSRGYRSEKRDCFFVTEIGDLDPDSNGYEKGFVSCSSFDQSSIELEIQQFLPDNYSSIFVFNEV